MVKKYYIISIILSFLYALACIISYLFHISRPAADKFSAIFIAGLTMPWSLLVAFLQGLIIAPIFKYEFNSTELNIILLICVVINTILIFIISKNIQTKSKARNTRS